MAKRTTSNIENSPETTEKAVAPKRTRRVTKPKAEAPTKPIADAAMELMLGDVYKAIRAKAEEEVRAELEAESPAASLKTINQAAKAVEASVGKVGSELGDVAKDLKAVSQQIGAHLKSTDSNQVFMAQALEVLETVSEKLSETVGRAGAIKLLQDSELSPEPVAPAVDPNSERMINLMHRMERRLSELDQKDLEASQTKPKTHYYSVNAETTLSMTQQELNRLMRANWILDKLTTYLIQNREPFLDFIRSDYVSGTSIRQIQIMVPGKAGTRTHMAHAAITVCNANIENSRWTMGVRGTYRQYSRDCDMTPMELDTILSALEAHIPGIETADRTVRSFSTAS